MNLVKDDVDDGGHHQVDYAISVSTRFICFPFPRIYTLHLASHLTGRFNASPPTADNFKKIYKGLFFLCFLASPSCTVWSLSVFLSSKCYS